MLGLTIIGALLLNSDLQEIAGSLQNSQKDWLALALALQVATMVLIAWQWSFLSRTLGRYISAGRMLQINMAGSFWESVTPAAKAGGEAVKVVLLKKEFKESYATSVAVVGLQKAVSMLAFFTFANGSVIWFLLSGYSFFQYKHIIAGSLLLPLFLVVPMVILSQARIGQESVIFTMPFLKNRRETIIAGILSLQQTFCGLKHRKKELAAHFLFGLLIWFIFPLKAFMAAKSLGITIGFIPLAVITFIAYSVAMLPLTPGGLGTFEGTMTLLLTQLGVAVGEALILALIIRFITFWFVFILSGLSLAISQLHQQNSPIDI